MKHRSVDDKTCHFERRRVKQQHHHHHRRCGNGAARALLKFILSPSSRRCASSLGFRLRTVRPGNRETIQLQGGARRAAKTVSSFWGRDEGVLKKKLKKPFPVPVFGDVRHATITARVFRSRNVCRTFNVTNVMTIIIRELLQNVGYLLR